MEENLKILREDVSDDEEEVPQASSKGTKSKSTTVAFQIKAELVESVKKQAIELDCKFIVKDLFRISTCIWKLIILFENRSLDGRI